jgi:hypothetical protein
MDASLRSTQEAQESFVKGTQLIIRGGQQAFTLFTTAGSLQVRVLFTLEFIYFVEPSQPHETLQIVIHDLSLYCQFIAAESLRPSQQPQDVQVSDQAPRSGTMRKRKFKPLAPFGVHGHGRGVSLGKDLFSF